MKTKVLMTKQIRHICTVCIRFALKFVMRAFEMKIIFFCFLKDIFLGFL